MSQLRLNPLNGRWSVICEERTVRSLSFQPRRLPVESGSRPCPFCPEGNTHDLPPTPECDDQEHAQARVVPNLYPAFEGTAPMACTSLGPVFTQAPGSGIHEVLLFGPEHDCEWARLDERRSALVMQALAERIGAHSRVPGLRYSQAIVNAGREAGASLEHPHGQLIGIPFVPREITDEMAAFARFVGNCLLCATVDAEESAGNRVVDADDDVLIVCPYWSSTPFEMLVLPRSHQAHLAHASSSELAAVGRALQRVLASLSCTLGDVAYNLIFHTAPYRTAGDFHWHTHLLPKVTTTAGFELGTGVLINVISPEDAATCLRAAQPDASPKRHGPSQPGDGRLLLRILGLTDMIFVVQDEESESADRETPVLGAEAQSGDRSLAVSVGSADLTSDLARVGSIPASRDVIDGALRLVTALASRTIEGADGVSVSLERHGELTTVAATNDTVRQMDAHQYGTGEGPCLAAAAEGHWFHIESLAEEGRWPTFVPRAIEEGIASILSTPLKSASRPLGALNIYSNTERAFGAHQQELAALFATQASGILVDAGADVTDEQLVKRITDALTARETIAHAQGVLMAREGITAHAAAAKLHRGARTAGVPVLQHAADVVASTRTELHPSP